MSHSEVPITLCGNIIAHTQSEWSAFPLVQIENETERNISICLSWDRVKGNFDTMNTGNRGQFSPAQIIKIEIF